MKSEGGRKEGREKFVFFVPRSRTYSDVIDIYVYWTLPFMFMMIMSMYLSFIEHFQTKYFHRLKYGLNFPLYLGIVHIKDCIVEYCHCIGHNDEDAPLISIGTVLNIQFYNIFLYFTIVLLCSQISWRLPHDKLLYFSLQSNINDNFPRCRILRFYTPSVPCRLYNSV